MRREEFEAAYGRLPSNVQFVDLDAQRKPPPVLTSGWTDEQIANKTIEEIDAMIAAGEKGLESLRETVRGESERVDGLRLIRSRRIQLGA